MADNGINEGGDAKEIVPIVVQTEPVVSGFHRSLPPALQRTIKWGSVAGLVVLLGWLFQVFSGMRGWVRLVDSRIILVIMSVVAYAACWIATADLHKRKISRFVLAPVVALVCVGLDRWAPKPQTVQALVTAQAGFSRDNMPPFSLTKPFSLNIVWGNSGSDTAHDFMHWQSTAFSTSVLSPEDEDKRFQAYLQSLNNGFMPKDRNLAPGEGVYSSPTVNFENQKTVDALLSGNLVIYVFAIARYRNDGTTSESQFCGYYSGSKPLIRLCYSHNGPKK